jgi:hypothetical protein
MLFLNKHQKSVFSIETTNTSAFRDKQTGKICEVRFECLPKFYFLDDDIEHNTSFHSNTNTLYYDNLSIFLFTFCYTNFSNR